MSDSEAAAGGGDARRIRWLTCLMFMMFAMTTDAVGSVIPRVIEEFSLSMKAAGTFHYVPMTAIAVGAILLGFLADRFGRRGTIILGLCLYGAASLLFAFGDSFGFFVALLAASGLGIAVFKTGALALIGDLSRSTREHTSTMNLVEGFFAFGAIVGPAIVAVLLTAGLSWKWLYVIAAALCGMLIMLALSVRYPPMRRTPGDAVDLPRTLRMMRSSYALGFATLIMLYVAVEVAIYVWMPTYLEGYDGPAAWLTTYALTLFFVLRAVGRFLGAWLLASLRWSAVLAACAFAILACFAASLAFGRDAAAVLLPLSGLFMSVMYPTLNSKGISCFAKHEHGAVAGVLLFFTALAAAAGPLAMAAVSDAWGDVRYGFVLATVFAFLLFAGLLFNLLREPASARLAAHDRSDYEVAAP
jgi:fucose permease